MAIVPTHRRITRQILSDLGFGDGACRWAASANAAVDEKQGNTADQANLHAMRGFGRDGRMQSYDEAERAVRERIENLRWGAVEAIRLGEFQAALTCIGEAHHTIQDREYHRFEPWPYGGLVDSILTAGAGARHGLPGDYMLGHAVRDLGGVTPLEASVSALEYGAHYTSGRGFAGYYWLELSMRTGTGLAPYLSVGSYGSTGAAGGPGEVAGYVALTWGAPPRSVRTPPPLPISDLRADLPRRSFCEEAGAGLAAYERAVTESRRFMEAIQAASVPDDYARFRASVNSRDEPPWSVVVPGDEPLIHPGPHIAAPGGGAGPSRGPVVPRAK